jgi:hypothetical protein
MVPAGALLGAARVRRVSCAESSRGLCPGAARTLRKGSCSPLRGYFRKRGGPSPVPGCCAIGVRRRARCVFYTVGNKRTVGTTKRDDLSNPDAALSDRRRFLEEQSRWPASFLRRSALLVWRVSVGVRAGRVALPSLPDSDAPSA